MLTTNMQEGLQGHNIPLNSISSSLMAKIIPYLYGKKLTLLPDELIEAYIFADMCLMETLKMECDSRLPFIVNEDNVCDMYRVLKVCGSVKAAAVIAEKWESVMFMSFDECESLDNHECFKYLDPDVLIRYLSVHQCALKDELVVVDSILMWLNHDNGVRSKHLSKVFSECIRTEFNERLLTSYNHLPDDLV